MFTLDDLGCLDQTAPGVLNVQGHSLHNIRVDHIREEQFRWSAQAGLWIIQSNEISVPYVKLKEPAFIDLVVGEDKYLEGNYPLEFECHFILSGVLVAWLKKGERIEVASTNLVFEWRDVVTGFRGTQSLPVQIYFERERGL